MARARPAAPSTPLGIKSRFVNTPSLSSRAERKALLLDLEDSISIEKRDLNNNFQTAFDQENDENVNNNSVNVTGYGHYNVLNENEINNNITKDISSSKFIYEQQHIYSIISLLIIKNNVDYRIDKIERIDSIDQYM